jgi:phosphoribosylamine--glycine ligase
MRILVVGTGAREHAICQSIAKDAELYSIMSKHNPGISRLSKFQISNENDIPTVEKYALENKIDMAIIGPEAPLEKGIVNSLEKIGIECVGPTQEAARIETDKEFMRNLFQDHNIKGSLVYKVFDNAQDAGKFIKDFNKDVVVKPIGLTGGKGVKIVGEHLRDAEDAKNYAKEIIDNKIGGHPKVVIEERLIGEEFTIQAMVDGDHIIPMPAVQDHPHAYEGDTGPITGGMGSYSDTNGLLPFLDQKNYSKSVKIMEETIKAYKGILYGQFMLCNDGPRLVEYNARFGDPEAMNVIPLINTSLVGLCEDIVDGTLRKANFKPLATVCKYIVPKGYPLTNEGSNQVLKINEKKIYEEGALIYYAAVNQNNNEIYTSSSRALALVAMDDNIEDAEKICEASTQYVQGDVYHRRDVGTLKLIEKRIQHMQEIRTI